MDTTAVTAAASDVWTRWAAGGQAEDIPTLMGLITENYLLDEKGLAPLAGRPAAQALWESVFKEMDVTAVAITPEQTVVVSGERVHQAGTYVETLTTTGKLGASTVHGRFAAVVVKDENGKIDVKNQLDTGTKWGAVGGGVLGLILAGLFFPLAGLAIGTHQSTVSQGDRPIAKKGSSINWHGKLARG